MARTTQVLKVPYYVKENFHSEYQGSLRRLEISIEEEYVSNLRQNCAREKNYSTYLFLLSLTYHIFLQSCYDIININSL